MNPDHLAELPSELHPEPARPLLPAAVLIPWLLVLLGWSLVFPAQAGERRARLTLELQLEGASQWQDHGDASRTKLSRHYRLVTYLRADGEPMSVNPKAPDYAQKMMERSARVQARVAQAQARFPGAAAPNPADQLAMVRKAQAACGTDRECLMRTLMPQVAARTTADAALQARLASQGAARRSDAADNEDMDDDARYLQYFGQDRCDAQFQVHAEENSEGQLADVQGPVPWRETRTATGVLSPDELRLLCLSFNLVLDLRTQTLSTDAGFGLPEPRAVTVRNERGRSTRSEDRLGSIGPVAQWVAERTRQAPRAGTASAVLPWSGPGTAARGRAEGSVQARLSWKLEDL